MAQTTQRAFALSLAILFTITTVGFSGYVIWQMYQESKDAKNDDTNTAQQEQSNSQQEREDPLKGQKLENFTPVENVTELTKQDIQVGDGAEATESSTVVVHYTGALAKDGTIFQSSTGGEPVTFSLGQVIPGFKEGITGMKVGGKRRVVMPADKAYGEQTPSEDIPPNSALVFDIELKEVK